MCAVNEYDIINPSGSNNGSSCGRRPFTTTSSTDEIESLGNTINFINNWLQK